MQPNSYQKKKLTKVKPPPSKKWKKMYKCHKAKGEHAFELILPKYIGSYEKYRGIGVEEYYNHKEEEYIECLKDEGEDKRNANWCKVLYRFRCVACGKQALSFSRDCKKLI